MELPAYGLFSDLICGAAELGMDWPGLLEGIGWGAREPGAFDAWLSEDYIGALWAQLMERTHDPDVALKLGEQTRRNHLINALMASSGQLSSAFERMSGNWHLLYPESEWRLERRTDGLWVSFINRRRSGGAELDVQYRLAWLVAAVRRLTHCQINPRCVVFRSPEPAQVHQFYRVFRCPVLFGAAVDALCYTDVDVSPLLTEGDPWLQGALFRAVASASGNGPAVPELPEMVRNTLRIQLAAGDAGIKTVAPRIRLSVSQLRNRLREHGTTYRELMESVRKQVCLELMEDDQLTIGEIGSRLGYSNTANFYRACKRWFGTTPTSMRSPNGH